MVSKIQMYPCIIHGVNKGRPGAFSIISFFTNTSNSLLLGLHTKLEAFQLAFKPQIIVDHQEEL